VDSTQQAWWRAWLWLAAPACFIGLLFIFASPPGLGWLAVALGFAAAIGLWTREFWAVTAVEASQRDAVVWSLKRLSALAAALVVGPFVYADLASPSCFDGLLPDDVEYAALVSVATAAVLSYAAFAVGSTHPRQAMWRYVLALPIGCAAGAVIVAAFLLALPGFC
jgi:hypothetical protein